VASNVGQGNFVSAAFPADSPVFTPTLDLQVSHCLPENGFYKPLGELNVRDQRDPKINRLAADDVVVRQFFLLIVLGNVDDEVCLALAEKICNIGTLVLQRPIEHYRIDVVVTQEIRGPSGREELHV